MYRHELDPFPASTNAAAWISSHLQSVMFALNERTSRCPNVQPYSGYAKCFSSVVATTKELSYRDLPPRLLRLWNALECSDCYADFLEAVEEYFSRIGQHCFPRNSTDVLQALERVAINAVMEDVGLAINRIQ